MKIIVLLLTMLLNTAFAERGDLSTKASQGPTKEVPDPGEEGKKTLTGIDSDQDGIRDDIQIWIDSKFPESRSPSTNKALKQKAKYEQLALTNYMNKELAMDYKQKTAIAHYCLHWIRDSEGVSNITNEYQSKYYNTSERIKTFLKTESYLHGSSEPIVVKKLKEEEHNQLCEFPASKE